MDRGLLSIWSLELTDDEFPLAFAAMGALLWVNRLWYRDATVQMAVEHLSDFAAEQEGLLHWEIQWKLLPDLPDYLAPLGAKFLLETWRLLLDRHGRSALRIAVNNGPRNRPFPHDAVDLLLDPGVGAASVFLEEAFASDGRIDWSWPFHIVTVPGDPLAPHFAQFQDGQAPYWPFRFAELQRGLHSAEVLVISASLPEALIRLLTSQVQLRASLIIVAGSGCAAPDKTEALARALAAQVSAEGVVMARSTVSVPDFAQQVRQLAYALTHNRSMDVALASAWPGALLMLNRDLLKVSRLDAMLGRVSQDLRQLSPNVQIGLSMPSAVTLGLSNLRARSSPWLRSGPSGSSFSGSAPEVADALEKMQRGYTYSRESAEASAISELAREINAQRVQETGKVPRYVRQESFVKLDDHLVDERRGYQVGRAVLVKITIGPRRDEAVMAPHPFPEDKLPFDPNGHTLQVMFHEPRQFEQPKLREVHLPPAGDSEAASFTFTPRFEGAFEARVCILHRGRVLQTLLLRATVAAKTGELPEAGPGIVLDEELHVRHDWSDLGSRRHFDMALVLNHADDGTPRATAVVGKRAWATDLQGLETPMRRLNQLISDVALSVQDHADGLDQGENPKLMVQLARVGSDLYSKLYLDQLRPLATEGFDVGDESIQYLQVVNARADTVIPLEFMYDFNPPREGASLCPDHRKALQAGKCPATCGRLDDPLGHVCPMGFWGLRKVIERHVFDIRAERPQQAEIVLRAEAADERRQLNLRSGALIAHSVAVERSDVAPFVEQLQATMQRKVPVVNNWDEWLLEVRLQAPAMLIAFPHNEGKEEDILLEIGGKKLSTLRLPPEYVRVGEGPPPVVFLLGCDVASTAQDFSSHVRYFRQAGAAVVISTIATVFGPHAVRVGRAIVEAMVACEPDSKARIGEVIRDAKRRALLDSVPMALCVVAFGDADWRL